MDNMKEKQQAILKDDKGNIVDLDIIPAAKIEELATLSEETQQQKLKEIWDSIPDAHKQTYGYCQDMSQQTHVTYNQCLDCGCFKKALKKKSEWEACKKLNLTK